MRNNTLLMSNKTGTANGMADDMSDIFTGTANSFALSGVKHATDVN
jgi:hypothetical protein